jgi:predicted nucleic acid-binding protein
LTDLAQGAALINPTPEDYHQAVTRTLSLSDQPISLFDSLVGVLATRLDVEVWTYDHHFDLMRVPVWR